MKARVKATGEIVDVLPYAEEDGAVRFYANMEDKWYEAYEIDIVSEVTQPDYWEKLKHQYAGMAMQAMISNSHNTDYHKDWSDGYGKWRKYNNKELAEMAVYYATTLVNKLKEESQCEK